MQSAMNFSVSLEAVPFPIAIIGILYFRVDNIVFLGGSPYRFRRVRINTDTSSIFPVSSMTANLQPDLNAGRRRAPFCLLGAAAKADSSSFPKDVIASASAFSVSAVLISRSTDGAINRSNASSAASFTCAADGECLFLINSRFKNSYNPFCWKRHAYTQDIFFFRPCSVQVHDGERFFSKVPRIHSTFHIQSVHLQRLYGAQKPFDRQTTQVSVHFPGKPHRPQLVQR